MSAAGEESSSDELGEILMQRLEQGGTTLPPLPEVGQRVLALVSDDFASAESLASLVQRDAGLASTLIRYSNSAALGGAMRTVSLQQAVSRLGMRRVAELAFMVSLKSGFAQGKRYRALRDAQWRRSLATGLFAKEIARELRSSVEVAFLCGLLRGVGPALVLHALSELPETELLPGEERAAEVSDSLGPAFLNAAIRAWNLPERIAAAIAPPCDSEARSAEASIAALAERLAARSHSESTDNEAAELSPDPDANALNLYPDTLDALLALGPSIREELDAL